MYISRYAFVVFTLAFAACHMDPADSDGPGSFDAGLRPLSPPGLECEVCKVSPDFTPCNDHGVCVTGVCWQFCEGVFGLPGCEAYPRGDDDCKSDVCGYYGLDVCPTTPPTCTPSW